MNGCDATLGMLWCTRVAQGQPYLQSLKWSLHLKFRSMLASMCWQLADEGQQVLVQCAFTFWFVVEIIRCGRAGQRNPSPYCSHMTTDI